MKQHRWLSRLSVVVVFVLLLTACAAPGPAAPAAPADANKPAAQADSSAGGNTVRIGAIYPLTGDQAKTGEDNKNGLQLAVDEINAAGGIKALSGAKLELVWGDSQGKPEIGISEVTRLVQKENVLAIIGAYNSSVTTPATQESEKLKAPFVVSMAVSDKITERGFKYTFRICPKASWYARDQVTFLKDLKDLAGKEIKKVALLHEDTDFGTSTSEGQKKYLAEAGMEMVVDVAYTASAPDLTTEVSKVKAANPDAVLTTTYLNDSILIAQAREALGMTDIPFVDAAGGTVEPDFIKKLGDAAEGWFTEIEYTKYAAGAEPLNNRFKEKFGNDITGNSAYAYQAGFVLADALERAGKADRDAIRDALAKTDLKSGPTMILPTDELKFGDDGQNPNAPVFIVQVQKGQLTPVWPGKYAAAKIVLGK